MQQFYLGCEELPVRLEEAACLSWVTQYLTILKTTKGSPPLAVSEAVSSLSHWLLSSASQQHPQKTKQRRELKSSAILSPRPGRIPRCTSAGAKLGGRGGAPPELRSQQAGLVVCTRAVAPGTVNQDLN